MAEDKLFGITMFGFDKNDVNTYIESMAKEFENKLRQKDEELSLLKIQNRDLKKKLEDMSQKSDHISIDKNKIVEVLLRAQENAEKIIEEAKEKSRREKRKLLEELQQEAQKVQDELQLEKEKVQVAKKQMQHLKSTALKVIRSFEQDVDEVLKEEWFQQADHTKVELELSGKKIEKQLMFHIDNETDLETDLLDSDLIGVQHKNKTIKKR